jgi:multidrug transporter EmrE-like cation transporter
MGNTLIAMLFGIMGSALYHIGKSMQKQGIGFIRIAKNKIARNTHGRGFSAAEMKIGAIYLTGVIFNNSLAVWIMMSNLFAPPSYFSSMFGTGIAALMIYSKKFLNESISTIGYFGIALLVSGTVILGFEGTGRVKMSMADIELGTVFVIIALYVLASLLFIAVSYRSSNALLVGLSFGCFSGGVASLDPVLKGIAQHYGGIPGFLPSTQTGWIIFIASFVFSTSSFLAAQIGFLKNSRASVQVSVSSCVYICFPIVIQGIALPAFHLTPVTFFGMALVVGGILLMIRNT